MRPGPTPMAESFFMSGASAAAGGLTFMRALAVLKNSAGLMDRTFSTGTNSSEAEYAPRFGTKLPPFTKAESGMSFISF